MLASVLQLFGLAVIVTFAATVSIAAAGIAAGAAVVYVGLALDGR